MRIGCIGWGSLIWKPGVLRCVGDWQASGPELPLEFARTSRDGRLTLALVTGATPVPTKWVELDYFTAEQAQEALAGREGCRAEFIGLWPSYSPKHDVGAAAIADWASAAGFDRVVWTALPPKFDNVNGAVPKDAATVLAYLNTLEGETLERAREYVTRAPSEVRTPFRSAIEAELGWVAEVGVADASVNNA